MDVFIKLIAALHKVQGVSVCVFVSIPMPLSACCSSSVKAVRGTSSDTGRMATVDRLEAGFPASHLLVGVCRARLRAARQKTIIIGYFKLLLNSVDKNSEAAKNGLLS